MKYFVSYHFNGRTGQGFGNAQLTLETPVRGIEDINLLAGKVKEIQPYMTSVVILSWQPFEKEEEA